MRLKTLETLSTFGIAFIWSIVITFRKDLSLDVLMLSILISVIYIVSIYDNLRLKTKTKRIKVKTNKEGDKLL